MKNRTRILALLMGIAMLVTVLAGCKATDNGEVSPGTTPSSAAATDSAAATEGVKLNLSISEALSTLDPSQNGSMWTMTMITLTNYGLMSFDKDGAVTYGLADSYDLSEDGLTYTFHIRDDAYWNNGDKVTAYDFLFAWQHVTDPATGSPVAYALGASGVKNGFAVAYAGAPVDTLGISAPDESTFVVELDAPRSYFLYLTALSSYLMPINEAYFNECGDQFGLDIDHYLACGPYVFSDWEVGGTSYTLVKNDKFYNADQVTAEELNFSVITDPSQTLMSWDSGALDFVNVSGDYVPKYKDDPALVINDMAAMFWVAFNMTDETIANDNLRMALSLAVDKQAIVDNILNNGSKAADYIIPDTFAPDADGVFFRDKIGNPTYNTMDKAKAAELWEKAKAELGVDSLTLDLLYNEDPIFPAVCAYLQSEWQNTLPGLTINLVSTTYNNRLELMGAQDFQLGFTRWYADYPEASTYVDIWTSDAQMNYGAYSNPDYDALFALENGEYSLDQDKRIQAQADMEKLILNDAAILPLYQLAASNLENQDYTWVKNAAGVVIYQWTAAK